MTKFTKENGIDSENQQEQPRFISLETLETLIINLLLLILTLRICSPFKPTIMLGYSQK